MQIAELERQEEGFRRTRAKAAAGQRVNSGLVAVRRSLIPRLRPNGLSGARVQPRTVARTTTKATTTPRKTRRLTRSGSVCGVRSIRGTNAPRIRGRGSCGIANPVKVTEVAGISLTRELVVNCTTAKRLDKWVARSVKPAIGRKGGGLASIQIIGGYACRTRNSKRGAKISEHAKGNAVDIAGFKLRNGTIYSVKRNWRRGAGRSTLRKIHKSACGPFGTVLGPNSDRYHQDHFHLDVARHRSGAYCR
ncbi:MAG: extensin family protein [Amylibacter sp.]|nr:extensin family protein [Amylibacter sp.]